MDQWLEDLLACGFDAPPDLVDRGIARLDAMGDALEVLTARAQLRWARCGQATFMPGRRMEPDDPDRMIRDLDEALELLRQDGDEYPELETMLLQMLTEALHVRDRDGDLERAVIVGTRAMRHVPAGTPQWAGLMTGLGERYFALFTRYRRPGDFAAADQTFRTLLDADRPARPAHWMRLGSLHEERFRAGGDLDHHRRALEILRTGWAEGSGYPMLALSFADAVINSGAVATRADLDAVVELSAAVDPASVPAMVQPEWCYLVMVAYLRRASVDGRRDPDDLRATAEMAERLIGHPGAEPGLRAEARAVRATAHLDLASILDDRMVDIDPIVADLSAAAPLISPELRQIVDRQLARVLTERARRSSLEGDADAAEAFAVAALGRLPEGSPAHAEVRYHLAYLLMSRAEAGRAGPDAVDQAIGMLRDVVADRATAPKVRAAAAAQLAIATAGRALYTGGDATDVDTAIAGAHKALQATDLDALNRVAMAATVAAAILIRYEMRGDLADLRWALDLLEDAQHEARDDPHHHELLLGLAQARITWCEAVGETLPAGILELFAEVLAAAPPGDPRRFHALRGLAGGYVMRARHTGQQADWDQAMRYAREMLVGLAPDAPFSTLMRMSVGGTMLLAGRAADDLDLVREGTDLLGSASAGRAGHQLRSRFVAGYGTALLELHRRRPRPGDLDRAVEALREADDLATGQPGQRGAAEIGMALTLALALAGDPAAAARAGRSALRARAWQVLLQSGTHAAMTAAQHSATDALRVARTALNAGDPAGAWSALETGRGLVLHAATVSATVPELLRRAGAADLAAGWNADPLPVGDGARWRAGTPAMPSDARFRAMAMIAQEADLLEPPTVRDLGEALTALDADALVYLCPGFDDGPGLALIVEPGGRVETLDLPALTGDWAAPAAVQEAVLRDLGPEGDVSRIGRTLAEVCRTGWAAAIRPLLDHWQLRHTGEPHLVLVPGGPLATVPWHATHGDGRWAIDEATFSSIASARLLVEVAGRTVPPPGRAGLVIGNPDTGDPAQALPDAGAEAGTIFRRYYPAGRYCGRPHDPAVTASSPGTPGDVLGWLGAAGRADAGVLHLACHGVIRADGPASSYLVLAGGEQVSAEEILRAAASRPAGRSPGLVSLAACTTHRAGRSFDEAVTLSTAFLVAGATTAIGSLWPVPDRETARLMITFHGNLAERGMRPHAALRAAQRSMRDESDDTTLSAWAGFVHLGW